MSVHHGAPTFGSPAERLRSRGSMLDVAAELLVDDPAASLASVAAAAGIGRTTLHKQYATREDLVLAVAHRCVDLYEQAVTEARDGGLLDLVTAMVPIGPQLAYLWRNPSFDNDKAIMRRCQAVESQTLDVLHRVQASGVLDPRTPDWWLKHTLQSLIYVAAESVRCGRLAPLDAPGLVVGTLLHGLAVTPNRP